MLLLFVPINCLLLYSWRLLLMRLRPPGRRRVAIVGAGPAAAALAESLRDSTRHGLELVGFIATPESVGVLAPMLGTVDDVPRLVATGCIEDVILASESSPWQTRLIDSLAKSATAHLERLAPARAVREPDRGHPLLAGSTIIR